MVDFIDPREKELALKKPSHEIENIVEAHNQIATINLIISIAVLILVPLLSVFFLSERWLSAVASISLAIAFCFGLKSEEYFKNVRKLRYELSRRLRILEKGGSNTWDLTDDEDDD